MKIGKILAGLIIAIILTTALIVVVMMINFTSNFSLIGNMFK